MFFELFVKSKGAVSSTERAAAELRSSGALAALSELGHIRSLAMQGRPATTESSALAKHWGDGYQEALKDIFHFAERYLSPATGKVPQPSFSVADNLYRSGEINEVEYETITGRKPGPA